MDYVIWFSVIVLFTYGWTASALMSPVRFVLRRWLPFWLSPLLHCPVCVGFWVALIAGPLFPYDAPLWVQCILSPAVFVTVFLTLRAAFPRFAAIDPNLYDFETGQVAPNGDHE